MHKRTFNLVLACVGLRYYFPALGAISPDDVTRRLRENQRTYLIQDTNVFQVETSSVASNDPIEDQHIGYKFGPKRYLFGVFDGHGGPATSLAAKQLFGNYVYQSLQQLPLKSKSEDVKLGLSKSFLQFDGDLSKLALSMDITNPQIDSKEWEARLFPALHGSCAIVSYFDTDRVFVANAGDSRVIVGSQKDGGWYARPLSRDLTASEPSEVARILSEHPGEPQAISGGRVLGGLMPSRALGDYRYKWDLGTVEKLKKYILPNIWSKQLKTPPYVTSEPEIIEHNINEEDRVVIIGSDGLWERLSNEEVMWLVGKYMEEKNLDYELTDKQLGSNNYDNLATYIIRHALNNNGDIEKLLAIPAPYARNFRDDITVVVITLKDKKGKVCEERLSSDEEHQLSKPTSQTLQDWYDQLKESWKKLTS